MKIYRYNQKPEFSLDDEELVELILYVNTYIGNESRCCYPCTEHKIQDLSSLRFMSEGRVLIRGRGIYTRVPFYKNRELYYRCGLQPNEPRVIVNNDGSYMLYELRFCLRPTFPDEVRLVGEIYP